MVCLAEMFSDDVAMAASFWFKAVRSGVWVVDVDVVATNRK